MSIETEITRISTNVSDTLSAVSEMGGEVPEGATSNNMAAGVRSIPVGAKIDDSTSSSTTTYSSQKIDSEISKLNEANATQDAEIAKKANDSDLAKVAKSGSYNDLTNKPTIPTVPSALPNPNALTFTGAVTGSYDGSAPMSVEIPSGGGGSSGGSGKAKSQILIDQEITELTASLSVTLEHDFHNLTAIIKCSSAGAALTADSGGAADASSICLLIDTTSFGYNSRKVAQTETSTEMWKNVMFGAEWSDDLSVFKRGVTAEIANGKKQTYFFTFGGTTAMYGTLGTDDNAPRTGKTANIVVNGAYLNIGTRVVLWGEYYE